tara:strand:+ start:89 stop:331 length:243 start_codon:yes stop_codon:yes gene_type:complete
MKHPHDLLSRLVPAHYQSGNFPKEFHPEDRLSTDGRDFHKLQGRKAGRSTRFPADKVTAGEQGGPESAWLPDTPQDAHEN